MQHYQSNQPDQQSNQLQHYQSNQPDQQSNQSPQDGQEVPRSDVEVGEQADDVETAGESEPPAVPTVSAGSSKLADQLKTTQQPTVEAIFDYPTEGAELQDGDLSFAKGDIITVEEYDDNWWRGTSADGTRSGLVPK